MNEPDYNAMSVSDLKKLILERGIARGVAVQSTPKAMLVASLVSGTWQGITLRDTNGRTSAAAPITIDTTATRAIDSTPSQPQGATPMPTATPAATLDAMQSLAAALTPYLHIDTIDAKRVGEMVDERVGVAINQAIANMPPREISLTVGSLPAIKLSEHHRTFPYLLAAAKARVHLFLPGPAGGGKTYAAASAANAMGLEHWVKPVGPTTQAHELIGYVSPIDGKWYPTPLYKLYKDGGVFVLDEIDAGHPGILVLLNTLLANDSYWFPNGEKVARHPDFVCIACANTYGTGMSREYVGRNQLDAATLDRFVMLAWDYDERLERAMVGGTDATPEEPTLTPHAVDGHEINQWVDLVHRAREIVKTNNLRMVVSPRASLYGRLLLAAGWPKRMVVDGLILRGANDTARGYFNF